MEIIAKLNEFFYVLAVFGITDGELINGFGVKFCKGDMSIDDSFSPAALFFDGICCLFSCSFSRKKSALNECCCL